MWWFDPLYFIILAPAILLSIWAQAKVKMAFARYSRVLSRRRLSGAQAASTILRGNGLPDVSIEVSRGYLSDHYDPRSKTLRLSPGVYRDSSIASVGVAAHEADHALQHRSGYGLMGLRSAFVPMAGIGSYLAFPLIVLGLMIHATGLIKFGIILFSAVVLFQVITLPVEFNASKRAVVELQRLNITSPGEEKGVSAVLNAAALTYVAAALSAILTLLYFLMRSGLLGGSDE